MALVDWSTADLEILREIVRAYRSGALGGSGADRSRRRQPPAIQEVGIGVTDEAIPDDGTSGEVTRWTVTSDDFAAVSPTETLDVHDFTETGIDADKRVLLLRLAHKEGTRWLAVQGGSGGETSRFIRFTTTASFTAGESPSATVNDFWGGSDPGGTVDVWDESGTHDGQSSGIKGIATFDTTDDKWKVTHPHTWPKAGESVDTVGAASEGSEAAEGTTHTVSSGGAVELWAQSRSGYFHAGDEKLYAYMRKLTFDSKGHLVSISAETRVEVDAPVDCVVT